MIYIMGVLESRIAGSTFWILRGVWVWNPSYMATRLHIAHMNIRMLHKGFVEFSCLVRPKRQDVGFPRLRGLWGPEQVLEQHKLDIHQGLDMVWCMQNPNM